MRQSFTLEKKGTSRNQELELFYKWVISRRTLKDLSKESNKSINTLRRLFKIFLNSPPVPEIKPNNNCHLMPSNH
jgi:hypothetical protein